MGGGVGMGGWGGVGLGGRDQVSLWFATSAFAGGQPSVCARRIAVSAVGEWRTTTVRMSYARQPLSLPLGLAYSVCLLLPG